MSKQLTPTDELSSLVMKGLGVYAIGMLIFFAISGSVIAWNYFSTMGVILFLVAFGTLVCYLLELDI